MSSEEPKPGENLYSYLYRRFKNEQLESKLEWCKTHERECKRCEKYPCTEDSWGIKETGPEGKITIH